MKIKYEVSGDVYSNRERENPGQERVIKIGKELVSVSEEIYREYYQMARRERYMVNDIKVGRTNVDAKNGKVTFTPSKEDSIERLMEQGTDFTYDQVVEDIICDKAMLLILREALAELNREEQELIHDLYYKELTVREIGIQEKVSHMAIVKRHMRILDKLKKYFL
ncbi:Sigma-70, region 4 [Sporomusa ovata DSM 2662]|nr:sigma factor-like helix-turn-helix DNA-binding protein [Sporomusa ovata]EQB24747.1 DNA-directed RNA polymerase specialized sigma subunit [Sporomusa ovata DSM 2662]